MRALLIATSLITLAFPAFAQEEQSILTMPDGQALLHISATERMEAQQDLLSANLRFEARNADAGTVQDAVNSMMKKAVDAAKKHTDVKVQTGHYNIYQTTLPRTKEEIWQGSQGLEIKSTNADAVLSLVGELQKMGLLMNGLSYSVSPERAAELQDSMMEAALAKLQTRASRAAKALGKNSAALIEVNVQGEYAPYPIPMHRGVRMESMALKADMAPPVAEAGETILTLSVSAKALIKP